MSSRLVVVGGAPATGKTTLAIALGKALSRPVITKDEVKESPSPSRQAIASGRGVSASPLRECDSARDVLTGAHHGDHLPRLRRAEAPALRGARRARPTAPRTHRRRCLDGIVSRSHAR